ncbi:ribulose-phosphate 3-epimerase, partial [Deltaproteobacteria bacterium OttesenSCG-928-K17]|nr:ribulose-phosphate 3-epimerase [Deltaproteobacteria bacterium OttesenSCG-928-K17]
MKAVAPSILSADITNLAGELKAMEKAGADYHHLDVMDGHFVPNLTFGPMMVEAARRCSSIPLDVHLMIDDPLTYGPQCAKAGADFVTFHYESTPHAHSVLMHIHQAGAGAGLALTPSTPIEMLGPVVGSLDMVVVMSVNPGFGGQRFIPESLERVARLREFLDARSDRRILIEVDGGVTDQNAAALYEAGADVLVSGSFLYGAADYEEAL